MMPDWNDVHVAKGLPTAKALIEGQLATANDMVPPMPSEADKNDKDDLLNPPPKIFRVVVASTVKS